MFDLRRLLTVEGMLKTRVVGQDHVAAAIAKALLRRAVDSASRRPVLSVLAAGPTGVGKTETARALAEILDRPLLAYDMASFGEPHTVAALIGAPPGYAGAERCGRLVADVQRHPDAVVLLDEIDKAHPTLFDPFMQVFDDGQFTELSRGDSASFSDTLVIVTTNLLQHEATVAWSDDPAQVRRMLLHARAGSPGVPSRGFGLRPELISRLDVALLYKPLSVEVVERIAQEYVPAFIHRVTTQMGICPQVTVDATLVDEIIDRCDLQFGVRELKRVVGERLGTALVEAFLPWMLRGEAPVVLEVTARGGQVMATFR
jgi:ATP-dependent Clp protease ATP-binding subunit ClpA